MVQIVLRVGITVASALIAIGLVLAVLQGHMVSHPILLGELPGLIAAGRPSGFTGLGVLVLLATPIVRVICLIGGFALDRDWRFAAVAVGVALLLAAGIVLGHA